MIKKIEGYVKYFVDDQGIVYSSHRGPRVPMKIRPDKDGYSTVTLSRFSKVKLCKVHRLVAQAFIPNPAELRTVNHKNGIKSDNRVVNLEWASHSQNNQHAYDKLGKIGPRMGVFNEDNPTAKPVIQYEDDGTIVKLWWSAFQAGRELGFPSTHITRVCNGKRKHTRGYKWRYATEYEISKAREMI